MILSNVNEGRDLVTGLVVIHLQQTFTVITKE